MVICFVQMFFLIIHLGNCNVAKSNFQLEIWNKSTFDSNADPKYYEKPLNSEYMKSRSIRLLNNNETNQLESSEFRNETIEYNCNLYTDCYNCSVDTKCHWCSSQDCDGVGICLNDNTDTEWYKELKLCDPNENDAMIGVCPEYGKINNDYSMIIMLPPEGHLMPKNGFCYWELLNEHRKDVDIEVINYEVINL